MNHEMRPCPGEAHQNAYIDHCTLCAPLWGKVPAFKAMSRDAQWVLRALFDHKRQAFDCPGLPDAIHLELVCLECLGYVKLENVTVRKRGCTVSFLVYRITDLGRDAAKKLGK